MFHHNLCMRIRVLTCLAVATTLTLSACGDSSSSSSGGDPNAKSPAEAYIAPGPYPIGVTTMTLDRGPKVEIWYPAVEGTTGTETYDVRDFTPDVIKRLLTGDANATYSIAAGRDAEVADGKFPVVLFSHGFSGIRLQSSFLTSHLASWGMVVIAPDHWSRDLPHAIINQPVGTSADSKTDLLDSLDLLVAENEKSDGMFAGHIDAEHVAAIGHSAGGGTILLASTDPRIDGFVSMASGDLRGGMTQDGATTTTVPLPGKPSFFLAGALDQVANPETLTRPAFERADTPSLLWIIDKVGHNGFDDFCTFGDGKGIIGVAESAGLGKFLDAQPQFRRLGEDGCLEPAAKSEVAFPIIRHAVTAWIRNLFGIDGKPLGLGEDVSDSYALSIDIDER